MKVRKPQRRMNCYRSGDVDFDRRRERFYDLCGYWFHHDRAQPFAVSLAGHYGFEPETIKRRAEFYANCARVFGWEDWKLDAEPTLPTKQRGKKKDEPKPNQAEIDGKPVEIARTGAGEAINHAADALQWLIRKDHLRSPVAHNLPLNERDRLLTASHKEADKRTDTAQKLAAIFEKAAIAPLRSPDFEAVPGGSFGSRPISLTKLQCIGILAELGSDIPPACMRLLEAIICRNEFPWHGKDKTEQKHIMTDVRMALDFASWSLDKHHTRSEMTEDEIVRRWPAARDWFVAKRLRGKETLAFQMDRRPG